MTELATLIRYVEDYLDLTREARELSERDRDYYDGKQLTDTEIAALAKRGQPPIVFNRIKPKVDSLLGFERAQRTDPRAYPRTPKHDKAAEGATDALRYVVDKERFQQKRSSVAENVFVEGVGGCLFGVRQNKAGAFELSVTQIPWDRLIFDPHSTRRDFSDAKYKGLMLWMDDDDAKAAFPGKEALIDSAMNDVYMADTFDDKPKFAWGDTKRKRVRVCQIYYREKGKEKTATFVRSGFLADPQDSPYMDEEGEPICPIELCSAYVDRDNQRYGVVRQHIAPQDEINKRRSKALHLLNVRQVIAEKGAVDNVAQARTELAKPDGYVEVNGSGLRFEVVPNGDLSAGHAQLLQEAKQEIDVIGVNPSLQGNQEAPSGRAQEMLQQAGLNELAVVFDSIRDWSLRSYRQMWLRIRQYWTEERWVRVTDDEENLKWVGLNRPMTVGEQAIEEGMRPGVDFDPNDPRLSQPAGTENEVAEMDMDIIVEDGPDSVNVQSEQFKLLVEMFQANPNAIPIDMVIEASSLRNKRRILERLKGDPEQAQAKQEQDAIGKETALAELEKTRSEAAENYAQAQKYGQEAQQEQAEALIAAEMGQQMPLVSIN